MAFLHGEGLPIELVPVAGGPCTLAGWTKVSSMFGGCIGGPKCHCQSGILDADPFLETKT